MDWNTWWQPGPAVTGYLVCFPVEYMYAPGRAVNLADSSKINVARRLNLDLKSFESLHPQLKGCWAWKCINTLCAGSVSAVYCQ